jgi:hypothetical protein
MQRVKDHLAAKVSEFSAKIAESHKHNRVPSDYSLGMVNGLIFCDHLISMRDGEPKFFDRTTAIGELPKPVVLKSDRFSNLMGAEQIFEEARDTVILAARNAAEVTDAATAPEAIEAIKPLRDAIAKMDNLVNELEQAQREASVNEPEANQN